MAALGEAIRNWLFRWFNPAPKVTQGNTEALLKHYPYIPEAKRTEEFVLSADIVTNNIRSDEKLRIGILTICRTPFLPWSGLMRCQMLARSQPSATDQRRALKRIG